MQEELAEKIDISANDLAGIERGEANPMPALLQRLSTGLEIPLSELFQYRLEDGRSNSASGWTGSSTEPATETCPS